MALPRFERADPPNASYARAIVLAQIAPRDLNVAVIGQLTSSQLPFNRKLEPGSLDMKGFQATLRRRRLIEHSLEDAPMDAHGAVVTR